MSKSLTLRNVRLAFPDLWKKGEFQGKDTGYGCTLLLPPNHPMVAKIREAIGEVRMAKWNNRPVRLVRDNPLRPAEEKDYAGFERGWHYVRANNGTRPSTLDGQGHPVGEDDGVLYSGCWVDAIIEIYAQDNEYGKAINVSIKGVKFRQDDEGFAGSAPAKAEDFEYDDDEDLGDLDYDYLS
jgi:hypothetical protein